MMQTIYYRNLNKKYFFVTAECILTLSSNFANKHSNDLKDNKINKRTHSSTKIIETKYH